MKRVEITAYTDGSAVLKYPFKGGFGIYIKTPSSTHKIRKGFCLTKTGRMELMAVIYCLRAIKNKESVVTIYSDSMYACNTCNRWIDNWESRLWLDVKNVDLLKQLIVELRAFRHRPRLKHIKGHQDVVDRHTKGNSIADELASYKTQKSFQKDLSFEDFEITEWEKEDFEIIKNKTYFKNGSIYSY